MGNSFFMREGWGVLGRVSGARMSIRSLCRRRSAVPVGTRFYRDDSPALPCRAFTFRRFAAAVSKSRAGIAWSVPRRNLAWQTVWSVLVFIA